MSTPSARTRIFSRPNSGRLIKAGSKIHFNLHLHPNGEATPVQISLALKLYPKEFVPKYVAFTQHMGDVAIWICRPARLPATTVISACRSRP